MVFVWIYAVSIYNYFYDNFEDILMSDEEVWIKTHCPKCNNCNWLCDGDMSDCTTSTDEAIECWNCGHKWWRDSDYAEDCYGEENIDRALEDYAEKGKKEP